MPGLEKVAERNLDGYGAPLIEWARVRDVYALGTAEPYGAARFDLATAGGSR